MHLNLIYQFLFRNEMQLSESWGVLSSPMWPKALNRSSCVYEFGLKREEMLQINIMDFSMGRHDRRDCNMYSNLVEIRGMRLFNLFKKRLYGEWIYYETLHDNCRHGKTYHYISIMVFHVGVQL